MIADQPTVSVIITNWNYAPYLPAAIDSVLTQTAPVHQCIVVDDGSTDGSRAIIESYGEKIVPVFRSQGGQAAAFNSGIEHATGSIIMFLDADDVLKPEAVETITAVWHPELAGVCFGMEVIDRKGKPCGLLPIELRDVDHRPLQTELGTFTFMPTSGNAFARRVIEAACPFPETRWKISADAYLLRIAALTGRMMPLSQVLAQYRVHEANNYYRVGASKLWTNRRAVRDIVDLARYLAGDKAIAGRIGLSSAEQFALQTAALRFCAGLYGMGDRSADLGRDLRRLARMVVSRPASLRSRLLTSITLFLASLSLWRNRSIALWLQRRRDRPRWVSALVDLAGHDSIWSGDRPDRRPRWRGATPMSETLRTDVDAAADEAMGRRLRRPHYDGHPHLFEPGGSIELELAPTPHALTIEIGVAPTEGEAIGIAVEASIGEDLIERAIVSRHRTIQVSLPRAAVAWGGPICVDLAIGKTQSAWPFWHPRFWLEVPPRLAVESVCVKPADFVADPPAFLPDRSLHAADFVPAGAADWYRHDDGSIEMAGTAAEFGFTGADQGRRRTVVLFPAPTQPAGWMRILAGELPLYEGKWGKPGSLTLTVPFNDDERYWQTALQFRFAANDPLESTGPRFEGIAFRLENANPVRYPHNRGPEPIVNAGQQLTFFGNGDGVRALGPDFVVDEGGWATLTARGKISLRIADGTTDVSVGLDIEQAFPPPSDLVQLVTVISKGQILAQVGLTGTTQLSVPLDPSIIETDLIELELLSVYLSHAELARPSDNAFLRPAPLILSAITIDGQRPVVPNPVLPEPASGSMDRLLQIARKAFAVDGNMDTARLETVRADLVTAISGADLRAMLSLLGDEDTIPTLARIGRSIGPPRGDNKASVVAARLSATSTLPGDREGSLQLVLLALLTLPASAVPALADLAAMPAPLLWNPDAIAAYLGEDPALLVDTTIDSSGYETFIRTLIASIDAGLCQPPNHPYRGLAESVLKALRPNYLLFGSGTCREVLKQLGRTMERYLVQSGRTLARRFPERTGKRRRRVGLFLRNDRTGPEAIIASAMIKGLDPNQFEPVLIVLEQEPGHDRMAFGCRTIFLGDRTIDACVTLIRNAEFDVLVLGSFVVGLDHLSAIVAHKLAPVQVATTAISPVTTGLSSFDAIISSPLVDQPDSADYAEPLRLAAGQIQAFDRPIPDLPEEPVSLVRRRLDLPLDTVAFVSGAMMHKIGTELMSTWARCLARVPGSILVLYPFAPNWQIDYAPVAFREWAEQILEQQGVSPSRLIIRTNLSQAEVARLLSACDVYLDSFPYAGATTVTEALDVGLPVVTFEGSHQRGRQGAGWLRALGLGKTIARSVPDYERRAIRLGRDAALRLDNREAISRAAKPHHDLAAAGKRFGDALIAVDGGEPICDDPTKPITYRYLFHHMPKTAGTSTRQVFQAWFRWVHNDYRKGWIAGPLPDRLDLSDVGPDDLIMGHFELPQLRLRRRYPEIWSGPEWRLFSIVRDPLELALSNYFFAHKRRADDPTFKPTTLSRHLRRKGQSAFCLHFGCSEKTWRKTIDRYWFIGTMERLEESLAYVADTLGKPLPEIPHENATERPVCPDPEDVEIFAKLNALDYEIYNEICARLDVRLSEARRVF
ncbi:glycosyltransferase [Devosia nitrariae]|nr:glycosyltransferase [Devosia nitrariae]